MTTTPIDLALVRAEKAVVRLPDAEGAEGGLGVLVSGGFIVTAAHCVPWTTDGSMTLGDTPRLHVLAIDGQRLTVESLAVEPVSDIAVLGSVDPQQSPDVADAFEAFCETSESLRLYTEDLPVFVEMPVRVYTHNRGWIRARIMQCAPDAHTLVLTTEDSLIEGGTSGGPVVADDGRLLGVVSHTGEALGETTCTGMIPLVVRAAPMWLVRAMCRTDV